MLDVLGIFVSGVMMLYIIVRAVQLDRTLPWFPALQRPVDEAATEATKTAAPPVDVRRSSRR